MRVDPLLTLGKWNALRFSGPNVLQEPRHILRQRLHGLQSLAVLADVIRRKAVYLVPILRDDNMHIADTEILIQAVNGSPDLAAHVPVAQQRGIHDHITVLYRRTALAISSFWTQGRSLLLCPPK